MSQDKRFKENLKLWALICPEGVERLALLSATNALSLCQAESGAMNIRIQGSFFLHSEKNPVEEANAWFSSLYLKTTQVIFNYGIGLGYSYDAAKEWLQGDKGRMLVFLEDDPEVMRCFLESERSRELLNDPQVFIYLLSEGCAGFGQLSDIVLIFSAYPFLCTGLQSYVLHKASAYKELHTKVSFLGTMHASWMSEATSHGTVFFRNCILNYLDLPHSSWANKLMGKFAGVPAIICGAGPSLDKNIDVLAQLSDRALIFAGGTAMNALNAKNILPHFGVGIDPNPAQFTRLVMNQAYETPFIYRVRMYHEALKMVHGDKLYVSGSSGYAVTTWLENQLGMDAPVWEEGFNVLNFSVVLAHIMGCNPIICVGIDLAYSGGKSYAGGIGSHPVHQRKDHFRTKAYEDQVLTKKDIYGQRVDTLWKWIAESVWYTQFAEAHPDVTIINATEGGIGFVGIENMTLEDVEKKYLGKQYALATYVDGQIQNSSIPAKFTDENIKIQLKVLQNSLKTCGELCKKLVDLYLQMVSSDVSLEKEIEETKSALHKQPAYAPFLQAFSDAHWKRIGVNLKRHERAKETIAPAEHKADYAQLEAGHYSKLNETALVNAHMIEMTLISSENEAKDLTAEEAENVSRLKARHPLPQPDSREEYRCDGHIFSIQDPELKFAYKETLAQPLQHEQLTYPAGTIKWKTHYQNGQLHGPSTFYKEDGSILSQAWFVHGKQEGKMRTYYAGGLPHSLQRYRAGLKNGEQLYFYSDGMPKSILPYSNGVLNGFVELYYSNGRPFRQIPFVSGKREGIERTWHRDGTLAIEASFTSDRSVGLTRAWHENGIMATEVVYDNDSHRIVDRHWDTNGKPIVEEERDKDYFQQLSQQTFKLTESIGKMADEVTFLAPLIVPDSTEKPLNTPPQLEIANQLKSLQQQMQHLKDLENTLKVQLSADEAAGKEALWKNPLSQGTMQKQLDSLNERMNAEIKNIEKEIKKVVSKYTENKDPS